MHAPSKYAPSKVIRPCAVCARINTTHTQTHPRIMFSFANCLCMRILAQNYAENFAVCCDFVCLLHRDINAHHRFVLMF